MDWDAKPPSKLIFPYALPFPHKALPQGTRFFPSIKQQQLQQSPIQHCFLCISILRGYARNRSLYRKIWVKNKRFLRADQHRVAVNTLSTALVEQGIYHCIGNRLCVCRIISPLSSFLQLCLLLILQRSTDLSAQGSTVPITHCSPRHGWQSWRQRFVLGMLTRELDGCGTEGRGHQARWAWTGGQTG